MFYKLVHEHKIALKWMPQDPFDHESTLPSDNKPLPEQMLIKIYVAMWRHQARKS